MLNPSEDRCGDESGCASMIAARTGLIIGTFALGLVTAGGIALAAQFWRVLPFMDQWEIVGLLQRHIERGLTLNEYLGFHNEHRPTLAKLLFLLDYELFRGTSILTTAAVVIFNLGL